MLASRMTRRATASVSSGVDLVGAEVDHVAADARARRLADLEVHVARLAGDGLGKQSEEELLVGERAGQGRLRLSRPLDDPDVGQVAVPLGEVESVADDEAILDGEAEVVDVHLARAPAPACAAARTPSRSPGRACAAGPSGARWSGRCRRCPRRGATSSCSMGLRQVLRDLHDAARLGALAVGARRRGSRRAAAGRWRAPGPRRRRSCP